MGIHMNHLSLFVVGGSHIFISDIPILRKSIERRIEVLCRWEKIASAGMIQLRFQALFDILCLDDLNDLLSLDNVPVGGIHAGTVNRLIAVVVCDAERPHKRIMVHALIGRLYTSGTAVGTMQDTSYPKYQTMELSAPILTAAHRFLDLLFDIVVAVIYIFLGSVTGQVQYRFLTIMIFLSFQELMNEIVILLPDLF